MTAAPAAADEGFARDHQQHHRRRRTGASRLYRLIEAVVVVLGLAAVVLATEAPTATTQLVCLSVVAGVAALFAFDYLGTLTLPQMRRLSRVPDASGHEWARSADGIIGLAAFLPMAAAAPFAWHPVGAPLFGALWILRLGRYSPSLRMLARVLLREGSSVLGVFGLFAMVLVLGGTLTLALEHDAQPDHFDTLPHALWWTLATLTTVGYGDMAPVTVLGRIVAGIVMICGIVLFGLLAGILASGFSAEVRRQEFLRNWGIVASVPIFHRLGAGTIGDLARVLRPREMPANVVITHKGAPGSSMYFIVSGGVKVELAAGSVRLGPGSFFGEKALLTGERRNATVVTATDTVVLELDVLDLRMLASSHPELTKLIEDEATLRRG